MSLKSIRRRVEAATPGPWRWGGNVKYQEVYLSTTHSGRIFVMRFVRWGLRGAQPQFQPKKDADWGLVDARDLVVKEADHRGDIETIDHPDATFIAHARTDIPALLAVAEAAAHLLEHHGGIVCAETSSWSDECEAAHEPLRAALAALEALP